jgi:hypothetical protein
VNDVVIVPELSSAIEGARLVGDSQTEEWIHERWDQYVKKRQEDRAVWPKGVKIKTRVRRRQPTLPLGVAYTKMFEYGCSLVFLGSAGLSHWGLSQMEGLVPLLL